MTDSNDKCWKCGKNHGPRRPTPPIVCTPPLVKVDGAESSKKPTPPPPTVSTPPIKWDEAETPSSVTPEQINQIRELTLKKVFLSVLLISIPILIWKLDSIIMAFKA
ncbi:hypothetical protein [Acinetobacter baumannii]|nr:hypothetical protein [Acinetobacter baumannii]